MNKQIKRLVCVLLMLSFLLGMTAFAPGQVYYAGTYDKASIFRIAGTDRFDTANKIAIQGWSGSYCFEVFLASADSYADALAGVPLAYEEDAPILLVRGDSVPESVMDTIYDLGASWITILGGTAAVSQEIEDELKNKGFTVNRIAGKDRYETAWQIALELLWQQNWSAETISEIAIPEIFVVSGENYPDALSVGPIAALKGAPIIYSNASGEKHFNDLWAVAVEEDDETYLYPIFDMEEFDMEELESLKNEFPDVEFNTLYLSEFVDNVTVVGGESAVGKNIINELDKSGFSTIDRIAGASRYETSLMVTERFSDVFETKGLVFSTGENFPDALAGGVFAAKMSMPLLLLNPKIEASNSSNIGINVMAYDSSRSYIDNLIDFINRFKPENVYVLGGGNAISDRVLGSYFKGGISELGTLNCSITLVDMFKNRDYSDVSIMIYDGILTPDDYGKDKVNVPDGEYYFYSVSNGTGKLVFKTTLDENGECSVKLAAGEYTVITSIKDKDDSDLYQYYKDLYGRFACAYSTYESVTITSDTETDVSLTIGEVTPK